jgi:hypothetical protein
MTEKTMMWVREPPIEEELKALFLELESILGEMGLLRSDYKEYRNLHFTRFCTDIHQLTNG